MDYHFSTDKTKDMKLEKELLIQKGYPVSEVITFVKKNLNVQSCRQTLQGKDNMYLVMPSTSGRNIIPKFIAARLQKEYGGEIIVDFARPMHETKTAYLSAIGKIREQRKYEIREQALQGINLKNKNVIIVDDVVSTGVSIHALSRSLQEKGIFAHAVISIAQSDKRLVSDRDIERFTEKLQQNKPFDPDLKNEVTLIFKDSLKHHLNTIEREITGDKKAKYREEVYEYIKRETSRAGRETEVVGRIQPGVASEAQLFTGRASGGEGLPVDQRERVPERSGQDRLGLENLVELQRVARSYGFILPPKVVASVSEALANGEYSYQEILGGMKEKIGVIKSEKNRATKNSNQKEIELNL